MICRHCDGHGWIPDGSTLRDLRLRHQVSAAKVAEHAGCNRSFICHVEKGRSVATRRVLEAYETLTSERTRP